jgi:hypothetical protein
MCDVLLSIGLEIKQNAGIKTKQTIRADILSLDTIPNSTGKGCGHVIVAFSGR